jgi:hypothetical protein
MSLESGGVFNDVQLFWSGCDSTALAIFGVCWKQRLTAAIPKLRSRAALQKAGLR